LEPSSIVDKELSEKVKELIYKHSKTQEYFTQGEKYPIDEHLLERLKSGREEEVQIYSIFKSLEDELSQKQDTPYYMDLKRRLRNLWEEYNRKQVETKQALEEIRKLLEDFLKVKEEEAQKPMLLISIHYKLKNYQHLIKDIEGLSQKIYELIEEKPYWREDKEEERSLRLEILKLIKNEGIDLDLANQIQKELIDFLKQ
jgi:hypothetical protein